MTTEDDFHRQLDANPNDHQTRLVFADWLQERGDPRAEGYRALGTLERETHHDVTGHWFMPGHRDASFNREHRGSNAIPEDWHQLIRRSGVMRDGIPVSDTRGEAEDAAALAFSRLPQERRAELLGQQSENYARATFSRTKNRYY